MAEGLLLSADGMKKIRLLLGSADGRINSLIQATVLDVCYNHATVDCTRTVRLCEFVNHAGSGYFDIRVLAPEHLLPEPGHEAGSTPTEKVAQTVWSIKKERPEPLIVLTSSAEEHSRLFEAGADAVVKSVPFNANEFAAAVRELLAIQEQTNPEVSAGWSLLAFLARGFHRLTRA